MQKKKIIKRAGEKKKGGYKEEQRASCSLEARIETFANLRKLFLRWVKGSVALWTLQMMSFTLQSEIIIKFIS